VSAPLKPFDEMTTAEKLAEIARRDEQRRRGLPLVASALRPDVAPSPAAVVPPAVPVAVVGVRRVRLPWSVLVPDNQKHVPREGRLFLTPEYREAKNQARAKIAEQLAGAPPLTTDVRLEARVYLPNLSRKRDVANLSKLVHDALSTLVYVDDSQIADTRWIRAGVDVDAPRCELTITSLLTSDSPTLPSAEK
jgi:Holliday junction resolvase RusA-like endonuclease